MGNLTTSAKEILLSALLTGTNRAPFSEYSEVRLMVSNGNADDAGIEVTGDSYDPEQLYWDISGGTAKNAEDISFDLIDSESPVIVAGIEIWSGDIDTGDTMIRIAYAGLPTPVVVLAGDSFVISMNNLEIELT